VLSSWLHEIVLVKREKASAAASQRAVHAQLEIGEVETAWRRKRRHNVFDIMTPNSSSFFTLLITFTTAVLTNIYVNHTLG